MRHYLGGENIHVSPRKIVRKDAELQEGHQNSEAGALAHSLDTCQYRPGAANQCGTALGESFGGEPAAVHPPLADEFVRWGAMSGGLVWHFARPPVQGLDFEVDVRGVACELVI
jgi:hypothetical protein